MRKFCRNTLFSSVALILASTAQADAKWEDWAAEHERVGEIVYRVCNDNSSSATSNISRLINEGNAVALSRVSQLRDCSDQFSDFTDSQISAMLKRSADSGYPFGLYQYGRDLLYGWGSTKDAEVGIAYMENGAKAGWTAAYAELVYILTDDSYIEPDLARARFYLQAAINSNTVEESEIVNAEKRLAEAEAQAAGTAQTTPRKPDQLVPYWQDQRDFVNGLTNRICNGDSVALAEFEQMLRRDHPVALNNMGWIRDNCGAFADTTDAEVRENYKRAAEQGYPLAQFAHGLDLLLGRGFPRNEAGAVAMLESAGDGNYGTAYARLARFFGEGSRVTQDVSRAERYLQLAYAKVAHPEEIAEAEAFIAAAGGRTGRFEVEGAPRDGLIVASAWAMALEPLARSTDWPNRQSLDLIDLEEVSNGRTPKLSEDQNSAFRIFLTR